MSELNTQGPGPLVIEDQADVQLCINALDTLTVWGDRQERQAAYDLLLRINARMGSDGRYRR